jgi:hypothetical protein
MTRVPAGPSMPATRKGYIVSNATLVVHPDDIKTLSNLVPTLPDHIETLNDAVATKLVADELRLPFMTSVGDLMVINGVVGMTSKLMLALVFNAGHRIDVSISTTAAKATTYRKYDDGWEQTGEYTFTQEDAEKANLWAKDTYQMYPADMLGHKVVARAVRFAFPDVLMGYIPDEMEEIANIEAEYVAFDGDAAFTSHLEDDSPTLDVDEVAEALDAEVVESDPT